MWDPRPALIRIFRWSLACLRGFGFATFCGPAGRGCRLQRSWFVAWPVDPFALVQARVPAPRRRFGQSRVHGKHVALCFIEGLGPDVGLGLGVDQLDGDAQLANRLSHGAG